MKLMIDTHIWVYYVAGMNDQLSQASVKALKKANILCVSAISCWEVALLVKRGRLGIDNVSQWIYDALQFPRIHLLNLTPEILIRSVFLNKHHPDPADRMIVATCDLESLPLVTADKKIRSWQGLETIW
ncbi:MAG: type II toxin-antitoxin system VapC family toxin [bacterium]